MLIHPLNPSGSLCFHRPRTIFLAFLCLFLFKECPAMNWGVAGHSEKFSGTYASYNVTPQQQLDKVKELGVTYYRVDARDVYEIQALVDLTRTNPNYSGIKIIPIIYAWFSWDDIAKNPNGYTWQKFYDDSYWRGYWWTRWWINMGYGMPFEAIEVENEFDNRCIVGKQNGDPYDVDGSQLANHYHDETGSITPNTIQGSYWRCQAILNGLCRGIRAAHPTVPRLVGCGGWKHFGFIDKLLIDCGNPAPWEGIIYHWYSEMGLMSSHADVVSKLQWYKNSGFPIWLTEVNCRHGSLVVDAVDAVTKKVTQWHTDEQRHANLLADQLNDLKKLPFVHAIFPYELLDDPYLDVSNVTEAHYGFYRITWANGRYQIGGNKDAVINAFRALMKVDDGAIYTFNLANTPSMCLDAYSFATTPGSPVVLFTMYANPAANQKWKAKYIQSNLWEFTPQHAGASGLRLDASGAGSADGTPIQLYTANNGWAQRWTPWIQSDGSIRVIPQCAAATRGAMDATGNWNAAPVKLKQADLGSNRWVFIKR